MLKYLLALVGAVRNLPRALGMVRYLMYVDTELRATTVRTLGTRYAATVSGCRHTHKSDVMPCLSFSAAGTSTIAHSLGKHNADTVACTVHTVYRPVMRVGDVKKLPVAGRLHLRQHILH